MILSRTYNNCNELPLFNFIKVVCNGDMSFLYRKRGFLSISLQKLKELWENIFSEYISLLNDPKSHAALSLMKEIAILSNKIYITEGLINILYKNYNQDACDLLKNMGFRLKFDISNTEAYFNDLKSVISQSKPMMLRLEQAKKELKKIQGNDKNKASESDFEEILTALSKYQGYRLNPKDITVSEYISIYNRYKKEIESLKNTKRV